MTTPNLENSVQKQEFISTVSNALFNANTLEFQKAIKQRLQDNFDNGIKTLKQLPEEIDYETQSRIDIEAAAKSFGGGTPLYDQGILIVDFDNKQSASHFSAWLDVYKTIESYELTILTDVENDEGEEEDTVIDIDFDAIVDDSAYTFEFIVYLNPDIISYADDYEEIEEQLSEVKRVIKISSRGKKQIKMKCNPGFKWDAESNSCQKISGEALSNMRKSVRKRLITMKSEGPSLQKRTNIKTKKAMKFRRALGLN